MEEILASIRRIIADDDAPHPPELETAPSSLNNVLDIAELHVSPLVAAGPNEPVLGPWSRGQAPVTEERAVSDYADERPDLRERREWSQAPETTVDPVRTDSLISDETSASVTGAFDRLNASLKPSQPQSVEDLMKEMLRPMLKTWLDDNLPPLVERLVQDEIERMSRRRG